MKLHSLISIGILAVLGAHNASAQEGKSRAQVRAELDEAIHSGSLLAPGDLGLPLNQLRPDLYPALPREAGKTRDQVKAELTEALRTGDIIAGESSARLNEIYPNAYPPVAMAPGKTREQARLELAEAIRSGDLLVGGEVPRKRNEQFPWSYRDDSPVYARRPHYDARRGVVSRSY